MSHDEPSASLREEARSAPPRPVAPLEGARVTSSGPPGDDAIEVGDELLTSDGEIELDGRGSTPEERRRARRIVAWLRGIAPRLSEPDAAHTLVEVAEQAGSLGRVDEALEAAREASRRDPDHVGVARAHRVAALAASAEREIVAALEGEARATSKPAARAALETERGLRLERVAEGDKAARLAFARGLDGPAPNVLALVTLERLAARDGDAAVAASYAKQLAEATADGALRAEHLARAARHMVRAGAMAEAGALAGAALADEAGSPLVALTIEWVAARSGAWRELVALRERQIEAGSIEEGEGWFDVGVIARYRLDDAALARDAFERAAARSGAPGRRACAGELLSLYEDAERWEDAVACARELSEGADPPRRAALLTRIGVISLERLGDEAEALAAFEEALAIDPTSPGALAGAGRVHQRRDDAPALVAMHRREADAADDPRDRAAALRRAGELLVERASTRAEGVALLREALAVVPADLAAFDGLEGALEASAAWRDLADLYDGVLDAGWLDPARRGFLLARLAQIAAEHLDDPSRALRALRALRDAPGGHPAAPLVATAARLGAMGDLEGQAEALARIAEQTASPVLAAATLADLAEVQARRGLLDEAAAVLRRATTLAPPGHPVWARAGRIFARLERHDDLLRVLDEGSRHGSDAQRARWLEKMAAVLDSQLGRPDEAIATLERARTLAPRSLSVSAALEGLLIRERRWAALAALAKEPGLRRAVLAEANDDPLAAAAAYRQAVDDGVDLARLPYLRALVATGRWEERMRQELATAGSPERVASARCRAAGCALEIGDRAAAAELFMAAGETLAPLVGMLLLVDRLDAAGIARLRELERRTDDLPTHLAVWRLTTSRLEAEGRAEEAVRVHEAVLRRHPADPVALPPVLLALGARGDRSALAARLRAALADASLDAELVPALQGQLAEVLEQLGQLREALDVLEAATAGAPLRRTAWLARQRIARALEDDAQARRALEALAALPPDGPERAICLRLLADDAPRQDTLTEALRAHPRDYETLRELRGRLRHGDQEAYTQALTRAFEAEDDERILAPLGNALTAQLLREGRGDRARSVCERVLAIAPDSLSAWMLSAELYERRYAFTQALDALQRVASHPGAEPRIVLEALRRIAAIALRRLRDPATARAALTQVDQLATDRVGLGVRLEIELGLDDRVAAAATLAQLATAADADEDDRARHLLQLARLKEGLGELPAAMKALARVRGRRHRRAAVERLFALGKRSGDWATAAAAIARALGEPDEDPRWEVAMRARLARILRDDLGRQEEALAQEELVARLGGGDPEALERLAAALEEREPSRAIGYHREILAREPLRPESYRAVRRLAGAGGDEALAFLAEAVLEGLGAADEEESYFYKQHRGRFSATLRALDEEALRVIHPDWDDDAAALLRAVDRELRGVLELDASRYGGHPDEPPPPLVGAASSMASLFGVPRYRLWLGPSRLVPAVEPGEEPLIVLPRALGDALGAEQRFVCAALMSRVALGAAAADVGRLDALSDHQLTALLEAARRLGRGEPPSDDPVGRDLHERLDRCLSDPARRRLAEVAVGVGEAPDGARLRRAVIVASARAAIVGAGDPALAVRLFRSHAALFGGATSWAAALPFAVSAELAELRARFGEAPR